jgi:hypothetical protein
MAGGTTRSHRKVIHHESSRASVLNHSGSPAVLQGMAAKTCLLTTPSLLSRGTQKREAAAPKASGCFMGGTCAVRVEPGKQKPRRCRAQELARAVPRKCVAEKERLPNAMRIEVRSRPARN